MVTSWPASEDQPSTLPALAPPLARLIEGAGPDVGTLITPTLDWVRTVAEVAPLPGDDTRARWRLLAETARLDVGAARMLEPHLDALAIIAEADRDGVLAEPLDTHGTWGVFAAEGGDRPVQAEQQPDGRWTLTGRKPWCSLAAHLDRALVTAWRGDERGLFAIDLRGPGVTALPGPWHARGLRQVVSAPIDLDAAPAVPVGGPGWYLRRSGFAEGGMGVAAVWWGSALPLVDALTAAASRDGADQLAAVFAGRADAASWSASVVLDAAAGAVDGGRATGEAAKLLAARVRAVVAASAREILDLESRALGPGPVAVDESHARRVADLELYLRQDHADRDLARLGRLAVGASA
ncbi:acyl-CoA dehydrogenase [Microbacterium sp. cx-59]|uniref:acyl-CoA dehydrogenase n=1 Tax=Microbacterium sp. cx-59 TaxID=2891207 RepID=UPI001E63A62C|nr:acyl-CoA dehydrogenase [Microbacterium sp. cx-59]MCC4908312.1 acyl-CoA dehydrogenase [Microbacterium sp. cx-59]